VRKGRGVVRIMLYVTATHLMFFVCLFVLGGERERGKGGVGGGRGV